MHILCACLSDKPENATGVARSVVQSEAKSNESTSLKCMLDFDHYAQSNLLLVRFTVFGDC